MPPKIGNQLRPRPIFDSWRTRAGLLWLSTAIAMACSGGAPDATDDESSEPVSSELVLAPGQSLVAGETHTCALLSNGIVRCWGDNSRGQLGRSSPLSFDSSAVDPLLDPVTLSTHTVNLGTGRTAKALFAGVSDTCAILDNDQLKCWGANEAGQLGQEDTISRGRDGNGTDPTSGGMGDHLSYVNLGTGRTAKSVAMGELHTCAILDTNQVKCWGRGYEGPLGYGDGNDRGGVAGSMGDNLPLVDLGTGRTAKAISATGYRTTCAILNDNKVYCWGLNQACALGTGSSSIISYGYGPGTMGNNLPAVNIGTGRTALAITAGYEFFCVLRDNGTVKCWGDNSRGQIGIGSSASTWGCSGSQMGDAGIVSMGGNDVVAVQAGRTHACALRATGEVKCWGANSQGSVITGQLGINANPIPLQLTSPSAALSFGTGVTARALAAGGSHSCMITSTNKVKCWGRNADGELGTNITTLAVGDTAGEMGGNLAFSSLTSRPSTQIATGWLHACSILSGGAVKCWGGNSEGQLGVGSTNDMGDGPNEMGANLPTLSLGTGRTAKWIGLGGFHSCAVLDTNQVKCWGTNWAGQLGYNDTTARTSPSSSTINLGTGLTAHTTAALPVTGGYAHTCALLSNNLVKCWGFNAEGQLGYGDTTNRSAPPSATVNLGTGRTAKAVMAGNQHTCAILDTNQIKCWGANGSGQLGYGDTTNRSAPPTATVNLGTGRTAKALATKGDTTCAWLDNNQVKCWGPNYMGQLGLGNTTLQVAPPSSSIDLGTSLSALGVSAGYYHVCALLGTNQVKCWGDNSFWQLGTWQEQSASGDSKIGDSPNEMGDFLATVFQGAGRSVKAVSSGLDFTCFLLDTDQIRCQGANGSGQLGVGSTAGFPLPGTPAPPVDLGPDP